MNKNILAIKDLVASQTYKQIITTWYVKCCSRSKYKGVSVTAEVMQDGSSRKNT